MVTMLVAFAVKQPPAGLGTPAEGQMIEVASNVDASFSGQFTTAEAHFVMVTTVAEPRQGLGLAVRLLATVATVPPLVFGLALSEGRA